MSLIIGAVIFFITVFFIIIAVCVYYSVFNKVNPRYNPYALIYKSIVGDSSTDRNSVDAASLY